MRILLQRPPLQLAAQSRQPRRDGRYGRASRRGGTNGPPKRSPPSKQWRTPVSLPLREAWRTNKPPRVGCRPVRKVRRHGERSRATRSRSGFGPPALARSQKHPPGKSAALGWPIAIGAAEWRGRCEGSQASATVTVPRDHPAPRKRPFCRISNGFWLFLGNSQRR